MATNNTSSSNPRAEKIGDVLDALSSGIAKTAANEPKFEPKLLVPEVPAEPARQLLTEIMLADRWVCSVARLQRWRTTVEWHPKLSHFEENLHPNLSHPNRLSCLIFEQGLARSVQRGNFEQITQTCPSRQGLHPTS
jgi:hypothetical protein